MCHAGYSGKNCTIDVAECLGQQGQLQSVGIPNPVVSVQQNPCVNEGHCYERSNASLYEYDSLLELPVNIQSEFNRSFSYAEAEGYVCSCMPGYEGTNCETDINECEDEPCSPGKGICKDLVGRFECKCNAGYEGESKNMIFIFFRNK